MKKSVFIIIVWVAVLCAFLFSACTGAVKDTIVDPVEYGIGIVPTENYNEIEFNTACGFFTIEAEYTTDSASDFLVATSLPEFREWCDGRGLPYFDESKEGYDSATAVKFRETYTDGYFEENALVLIHYVMSSYDTFDVDGLRLSEGFLAVVCVRPKGEYSTADVLTSYFGIFEVNKEDVSEVKTVNIGFIRK